MGRAYKSGFIQRRRNVDAPIQQAMEQAVETGAVGLHDLAVVLRQGVQQKEPEHAALAVGTEGDALLARLLRGATLPRDGVSQGELMVRGHWILRQYYRADTSALVDGWFPTGDIATIDAQGVMQIRDRTKDVIKTGGEWISSIDLENAAIAHPAVAMAAVIGVKHPKWDERPLMFVVRKPGQLVEKEEILSFLETKVAKWWVPDDVIFLESLPVGGTGKVQKGDLRKTYGGVFS